MRNWLFGLIALLALSAAGCRAPHNADNSGAPNQAGVAPQPYTRIANADSNTVQLQIAIRRFVPERGRGGPVIWLVGTSHIGEAGYYRTVQDYLDARNVVLYEGINAGAHKLRITKPGVVETNSAPQMSAHGTNEGFSMQSALAQSLGLVFQLDAIDYDRTNFINSDLSVLQIERLMIGDENAVPVAPGQGGRSSPSFDALLQIMDGSSFLGGLLKVAVQFIGSNPNLQAITRLIFIDAIGNIKGDFSEIPGLPPDMQHLLKVLIEARNQNVVDDLKEELKVVPRSGSIAVFYGTGHMDNLEKSITRQLHYRPAGDIWLTAFSVDLRQTGLPPGQLLMLRNLVKYQIDQMHP